MLGYPDRSLEELRAAVGSAETLGHPLTLAQTLCYGVLIHVLRHEPPAASAYAERALRICEEQRISQYHAVALCLNGWALRASGESEKGLAQIAQGVDSYGGHWFSLMGICFPFPMNRLCHLHVENFTHRQPPFDHAQSDSGDFSGRKMDAKKIVDHPIDM